MGSVYVFWGVSVCFFWGGGIFYFTEIWISACFCRKCLVSAASQKGKRQNSDLCWPANGVGQLTSRLTRDVFFFFSLLLLSTERALVVWHFIKDLIKCPSPAQCLTLNFALRSVGTEAVFLRYVLIRSLSLFPFLFHIRSHTACCSFALAVWVELIPTQIPRDYESCQNRKYFLVLMLRGGKKHTVSLYPSLS